MDKKKIGEGLAGAWRKATDAAKEAKVTVQEMAEKTKQKSVLSKKNNNKQPTAEGDTNAKSKNISAKRALSIIYYVMVADGTVLNSEEEKFDAIGAELDPAFADNKAEIMRRCQAQLDKVIDSEDLYDVLKEGIEAVLAEQQEATESLIPKKLLVWNLLVMADSDNSYDATERKLIKYIVRQLEIDKAVFLEMESSLVTMKTLDEELAWIKTTDRPYLMIEARVNELEKRKSIVFESIKDLITL